MTPEEIDAAIRERAAKQAGEPRPDVQAIVEIDRIMRTLNGRQQHAVIAWLTAWQDAAP